MKKKFYTVIGMKRVCMGVEKVTYPDTFTNKKAAAKFVAARMNEAIDKWNTRKDNRDIIKISHVTVTKCFNAEGYMFGSFSLNIVEHDYKAH